MTRRTQTLIGTFTAVLWILVGVYFIGAGESIGWQIAGGAAVAFGILRGVALLAGLRGPKPPEIGEEPGAERQSDDEGPSTGA